MPADMLHEAGELIRVRLGIGEDRVLCQQTGDVQGGSATCVQDSDPQHQKGSQQIPITRVTDDPLRIHQRMVTDGGGNPCADLLDPLLAQVGQVSSGKHSSNPPVDTDDSRALSDRSTSWKRCLRVVPVSCGICVADARTHEPWCP
ncbi:hypothetical protein [Streptomyces sp. NPDC092903]|uniref:hypothetical protein n=1 Tax=Streptomyces sp. NPDC092903 TaxID=3366017 RepID=UPI003829AD08